MLNFSESEFHIVQARVLPVLENIFSRFCQHFWSHIYPNDPACFLNHCSGLKHVKATTTTQIKHNLPFMQRGYRDGVTAR